MGKERRSILDHIYLNNNITNALSYHETDHSDHLMLMLKVERETKNFRNKGIYTRNWKGYNPTEFNRLIQEQLSSQNLTTLDVDNHAERLDQILLFALEKIAPEIYLPYREAKFAWSRKILRLRRKRKHLLRKAKRNRSKSSFKKCRNITKTIRREIRKSTKESVRHDASGNRIDLWRSMGKIEGKSIKTEVPRTLHFGNKSAEKDDDKAELFADYFYTKIANIKEATQTDECFDGYPLIDKLPNKNPFENQVLLKIISQIPNKSPSVTTGYLC